MPSTNMPQPNPELENHQREHIYALVAPQAENPNLEQKRWLARKPADLKVPTDRVMVEDEGLFHYLSSSQ